MRMRMPVCFRLQALGPHPIRAHEGTEASVLGFQALEFFWPQDTHLAGLEDGQVVVVLCRPRVWVGVRVTKTKTLKNVLCKRRVRVAIIAMIIAY